MNKVITAVGMAVVSTASLCSLQAQNNDTGGLAMDQDVKAWYLAASIRGFYDDNYLTQPSSVVVGAPGGGTMVIHPKLASWGAEFIPSFGFNHQAESTTVTASYVFDGRYYFTKSDFEQSHQLNLGLTHEFSTQYKIALSESFVVAQEPTIIDTSVISSPLRVEGNNLRNTGQVNFTDSLTKDLDLHLGYGNTLYDYPQLADSVIGYPFNIAPYNAAPYPPGQPSRSALLNRMEQLYTLDLRWKATDSTTGVLGYQFGQTWYTSGEWIIYPTGGTYANPSGAAPAAGIHSNIRDYRSHYVFIGADESFTPQLNGSIRAGAEYLDYYNEGTSRVSPYVDASITDQYTPVATAQLGVKHVHNGTDVAGTVGDLANGGSSPVLDEESTAVYLSDTTKLSDRLTASVMGQAQLSTFVGGGPNYNDKMDAFFILQVNFKYQWNPWFSTEAGYNYNRLKSDLPDRAYTRNFMYVGLRATY